MVLRVLTMGKGDCLNIEERTDQNILQVVLYQNQAEYLEFSLLL